MFKKKEIPNCGKCENLDIEKGKGGIPSKEMSFQYCKAQGFSFVSDVYNNKLCRKLYQSKNCIENPTLPIKYEYKNTGGYQPKTKPKKLKPIGVNSTRAEIQEYFDGLCELSKVDEKNLPDKKPAKPKKRKPKKP